MQDQLRYPSYDENDLEGPHLVVMGSAKPALRFVFESPVEEIVIEYQVYSGSDSWEILLDGREPESMEVSDTKITINGAPFTRVDIIDGRGDYWKFFRLHYWERKGPIGDIVSEEIYVEPGKYPVTTPQITSVYDEKAEPILDSKGNISVSSSNVKIAAHVLSHPEYPHAPVRLMVGRSNKTSAVKPSQILTKDKGAYAPVIYLPYYPIPILSELVAYWPFDGHIKNLKDGKEGIINGRARFITEHPVYPHLRSIKLLGDTFIELRDQKEMQKLGNRFTLQMWINPSTGQVNPVIFDNDHNRSFGLSLQTGTYKLRFWLNGTKYFSNQEIVADCWTHIAISYNGSSLFIYVNYQLDSQYDIGSSFVNPGRYRKVTIGAARSSTSSRLRRPFTGGITDVQLWQEALHPREADDRLKANAVFLDQQKNHSTLVATWPGNYDFRSIESPVQIENRSELDDFGKQLTLQAWVKPSLTAATNQTILGNKLESSFWLGLLKEGTNYRVCFCLNNDPMGHIVFHSNSLLKSNSWTHISIRYNGSRVYIYLNGRLDVTHSARLGRVRSNPERNLVLGADSGSTEGAMVMPFHGMISDVKIWKDSLSFNRSLQRLGKVQYTDRFVKDGRYAYFVSGVDIFGRKSKWSNKKIAHVEGQPSYNAPVNIQGQFIPFKGEIVNVIELEKSYQLIANIDLPDSLFSETASRQLIGCDLRVHRTIESTESNLQQRFEIISFEASGSEVQFEIKKMPFAQLIPSRNDRLVLHYDIKFSLQWAWTGAQRLFQPGVDHFNIYIKEGPLNTIQRRIIDLEQIEHNQFVIQFGESIPSRINELVDKACQIGPHLFFITENSISTLNIQYEGHPVVEPNVGDYCKINITEELSAFVDNNDLREWGEPLHSVAIHEEAFYSIKDTPSHYDFILPVVEESTDSLTPEELFSQEERTRLKDLGVDWIPSSVFYKVSFSSPLLPEELADPSIENYLPGSLVAYNEVREKNQWQVFYVLWHEQDDLSTILYILPHEKNEPIPELKINRSYPARFYPGEHFNIELELSEAPTLFPSIPTKEYIVCLTSSDADDRQSSVSRKISLVAIDRRRPATPAAPRVEIMKADYYNKSKVNIEWEAEVSDTTYLLYRSTDSAIITRDLQQRRESTGYYKDYSAEEIFQDDWDFEDWWRSRNLPEGVDEVGDLFAEKESTRWHKVTPIWRAWAERYYPSLSDDEMKAIAELDGNEGAFTLVHAKPTKETTFTDSIPGLVRNRYFYRLRTQNAAIQQSSDWGAVSDPAVPVQIRPPKAPVITKIEAEDRKLILYWSIDRNQNISEYRIYRSDSKGALEDLRWWHTTPDPRIIASIPDPLLRVSNRKLEIPGDTLIESVIGVYRTDEFNFESTTPEYQPQALNYYNTTPSAPEVDPSYFELDPDGVHLISSLRRICNDIPVVLVYQNREGQTKWLNHKTSILPYIDEDLIPLQDYHYRIVTVDSEGNHSEPSAIISARCPEIELPQPPEWISGEWVRIDDGGNVLSWDSVLGSPAILLNWEVVTIRGSRIRVQRKSSFGSWKNITDWLPEDSVEFIDTEVKIDENNIYRIMALSSGEILIDVMMS